MSLNKIEKIVNVNDNTPNFQIRNFYYDSSDSNINMQNGNYIPNNTDNMKQNRNNACINRK